MRRILVCSVAFLFLLTGCSGGGNGETTPAAAQDSDAAATGNHEAVDLSDVSSGDVIEIGEKLFIAQTNDIYLNSEDYLGKTIRYEGMFFSEYWEYNDETYYMVIRYGPGCCGYDGNAGFEITWDEGVEPFADDTWVEVTGVLETFEDEGYTYLRLNVTNIVELDERGAEYVAT